MLLRLAIESDVGILPGEPLVGFVGISMLVRLVVEHFVFTFFSTTNGAANVPFPDPFTNPEVQVVVIRVVEHPEGLVVDPYIHGTGEEASETISHDIHQM